MKYQAVPLDLVALGDPIPVDLWSPDGRLLLRKGQTLTSADHRSKLLTHQACALESEAQAWQRAYERRVQTLLREGAELAQIAQLTMPTELHERDFRVATPLLGGWLDVQVVLRGILQQGLQGGRDPLQRLLSIEAKVRSLLQDDMDDGLFTLFQALADNSLGYSASHALLCAALSELVAQKIGQPAHLRQALLAASLTMNIGMSSEQDVLSRQNTPPTPAQRALIDTHAERGVELLRTLGVEDEHQLDIVRWHHDIESPEARTDTQICRRILGVVDVFVARVASRQTRAGLSPIQATRSAFVQSQGQLTAPVSAALAAAVGFYPPGSYVQLASGDIALVVQRGARANTPWVMSLINAQGVPSPSHVCLDTSRAPHTVTQPVAFDELKVTINIERVRRARSRIPTPG